MALDDRARWDEKHATKRATQEPATFLKGIFQSDHWSIPRGQALDIATGKGQNAIFLAEQGFEVLGIDISPVALEEARRSAEEKSLKVNWQQADLEVIELPPAALQCGSEFQLLAAFSRAANQKVAQARWLGDLRDLFNRSTEHRRAEKPGLSPSP
jgi:SAM-dependent methyltransferase